MSIAGVQVVTRPTSAAAYNTSSTSSTASGYLALLNENDDTIKSVALKKLLVVVDVLWHEIAEALPDLEALAEGELSTTGTSTGTGGDDAKSKSISIIVQQTAAAVASRVFFHLQEPQQALRLALLAGDEYFDVLSSNNMSSSSSNSNSTSTSASPYVERLVSAAFDAYIKARKIQVGETEVTITTSSESATTPSSGGDVEMNTADNTKKLSSFDDDYDGLTVSALQPLVYRLLDNSCANGKYDHALGIALEAREASKVRMILQLLTTQQELQIQLLRYTLQTVTTCVTSKHFRSEIFTIIAELWLLLFNLSSDNMLLAAYDLVTTYQLLYQANDVATILLQLLQYKSTSGNTNEQHILAAYQLCFDLMDTADQTFIQQVTYHITSTIGSTGSTGAGTGTDNTANTISIEIQNGLNILQNGYYSSLVLSFLYKQNNADRHIMETLKKSLEERTTGSRSSILHNSSVLAHAYLYAGTTNDSFLRDYLDWMKKASNWAKFSATASLGVVHASHATEAMQILQPYLPPRPPGSAGDDGTGATAAAAVIPSTGGYAEGGSLYALGLIHGSNSGSSATQRNETIEFLRSHVRTSHTNEVISHGACLGLGLAAMGTNDISIVNEIKEVLDTDSAVAGEAAGMAIGMVLVGSGAGNAVSSSSTVIPDANKEELMDIISELKNYARETQHEKIIRGVVLGLALINYGQEENADTVIEEMRSDRDPIMRYGAQYAIALAYCGTGSNKAVRILLHTAVSDVSNDVRMAAVISLAFVLYKTPDRVPQLVKLLLESFNPYVRYGACMAVGIAMAGSGDADSIALLEPMLDDMTDYVRQGALIGTSMIYMQQSDSCNRRKIKSFRDRLMTTITEKHQSTLTKMGAILSIGIIDAGGRNCSLTLGSRNGYFTKMTSAVGLVLWLQHWYWYPMMHMLSLGLTPTVSIGLNKDFKYPKNFKLICHAKPSMFSYPKKLEEKKEEKKKRVETVTLSITVKEKARLARKKAKQDGSTGTGAAATATDAMDIDKPEEEVAATGDETPVVAITADGDAMDVEDTDGVKEDTEAATTTTRTVPKKKKEPEPTMFEIGNPARVTKIQAKYCVFDMTQRYRPVRVDEKPQCGVIMLMDTLKRTSSTTIQQQGTTALLEEDDDDDNLGTLRVPSLEPEGELPPPESFVWYPPPPPPVPVVAAASSTASVPTGDKATGTTTTTPKDDTNKKNEEEEEEEENASSGDDKVSSAESSTD